MKEMRIDGKIEKRETRKSSNYGAPHQPELPHLGPEEASRNRFALRGSRNRFALRDSSTPLYYRCHLNF